MVPISLASKGRVLLGRNGRHLSVTRPHYPGTLILSHNSLFLNTVHMLVIQCRSHPSAPSELSSRVKTAVSCLPLCTKPKLVKHLLQFLSANGSCFPRSSNHITSASTLVPSSHGHHRCVYSCPLIPWPSRSKSCFCEHQIKSYTHSSEYFFSECVNSRQQSHKVRYYPIVPLSFSCVPAWIKN